MLLAGCGGGDEQAPSATGPVPGGTAVVALAADPEGGSTAPYSTEGFDTYLIGKDSTVLLWLARRAFFGHVPFPLVHVDTSYKIPEMIDQGICVTIGTDGAPSRSYRSPGCYA